MAESDRVDVEVLGEQDCQRLLATRYTGRIAFTVGVQPEIFPVHYVADGSTIVFRTGEENRLLESSERRVVFEIDDVDTVAHSAWSVIVRGEAHEITHALDGYALSLRAQPLVPLAPGKRERWLAIYPAQVSGRRFRLT